MRNLQAAWEAIEKGDSVEAQSIVAQILRDDPKNAEAWLVLGEAVSGDRKALFYRKAMQLDPNLTIAKDKLAELEAKSDDEIVSEIEELKVPPGVSLNAPTVPIEERLSGNRAVPQSAQSNFAPKAAGAPKSNTMNNIFLILIALGILIVIYLFIQSLPV